MVYKIIVLMCVSLVGLQGQSLELVPYRCDSKWGYCMPDGSEVIDVQYDSVHFFIDKTAVVELNSKYGLIDKSGEFILDPKFDEIVRYDQRNPVVRARYGKKWKIYDQNGRRKRKLTLMIETTYDCVSFTTGFDYIGTYIYSRNGKYGFKKYHRTDSLELKEVIYEEPIYDEYIKVANVIALRIDEKWQLYNYGGRLLNTNYYDNIDPTSIGRGNELYFKVVKDEKIGLISQSGEEVIKPKYKSIELISKNIYSNIYALSKIQLFKVQDGKMSTYFINEDGFEYKCSND